MFERGSIRLPGCVAETVKRHPVFVEICYAITHAIWEEYPFPQTNRIIRELYYQLGPQRLVWGSYRTRRARPVAAAHHAGGSQAVSGIG